METWHGTIKTAADAIKVFEACRLGLLPRVQRRLSERERHAIRPGSVFVWDEHESGMRRWTDGKAWSASRVAGSFLTYREIEGKRGAGFNSGKSGAMAKTPEASKSDEEKDEGESSSSDRYKRNGLMKQSFSITTTNDHHLHLISYSAPQKSDEPELPTPSTDPSLSSVRPPKGLYPESSVGDSPRGAAFTNGPMRYPPNTHQPVHRHLIQQRQYIQSHPHQQHHYTQQHMTRTNRNPSANWLPSPLASPHFGQPHGQQFGSALPYEDRRLEQQQQQYHQQLHQQQQLPHYHHPSHEPRSYPPPHHSPTSATNGRYEAAPLPPIHDHDQQRHVLPPFNHHAQQHQQQQQPASSRPEDSYILAARAAQVMVGSPVERQKQGISLPPITTMAGGSPVTPVSAVCKLDQASPRMPYTPLPNRRPVTESPPQSARSDVAFPPMPLARSATSISSLLLPTHSSMTGTRSEGGNSPQRTMADMAMLRARGNTTSEDMRALNVLNKSFAISK